MSVNSSQQNSSGELPQIDQTKQCAARYQPDLEPLVSFDQKEQLERERWQQLKTQLLNGDLELGTGPLLAHVQFSNYCNLSCIMCWNGKNPRTRRMSPELLEKVGAQLGPKLSLMVPISVSEPLILTWDETRQIAERYGVLLRITTNLQFLDEAKFNELKDITETLSVSVDCHIPEILEKIRQRAKVDTILENLVTTARLSREHGIECIANAVLLTYNAPFLPDTIRYFHEIGIESVDVIQMADSNNESYFFDPLTHFSEEYIGWIRENSIEVAKELKMRLIWNVGRYEIFDFRENPVPPHPRKVNNDYQDYQIRQYVPGFCSQAYNGFHMNLDGNVAPCFFAAQGQLPLGNLKNNSVDEIWNGVNAQDLRRGMYTGDVPARCQDCRFHRPIPPRPNQPFVSVVIHKVEPSFFKNGIDDSTATQIVGPPHANRSKHPPKLKIQSANGPQQTFLIALALGGSTEQIETFVAEGKRQRDGSVEIEIPPVIWQQLKPNLGYWWTAWYAPDDGCAVIRTEKIQCLVRHQSIPRLDGSTLHYADSWLQRLVQLGARSFNKIRSFGKRNA